MKGIQHIICPFFNRSTKAISLSKIKIMNDSKSGGNHSLENQVTYECSYIPNFSWNNDSVSPIATYVVSCVACPLTVTLNMLIIVVVIKKKTLQSNINILLCSMAVTDLLVGAVIQPVSIVSGAFFFQGHEASRIHCTLETANAVILVGTCTCSVYHLTAIAWQRHARISLDLVNNPTIVSRRRIKVLIFVAWLTAFISTIPSIMIVKGVYLQYSVYLDTVVFVTIVISWILVVYYYVSIFVRTRRINFHASDQNATQAAAKAKMERRIALTSGLLTMMVFLFYSPNLVFVLCYVNPFFCKSSYLLWALTLITLNSLANPILYCYRNRQLRQAVLELLGRETWEMPPALPLPGQRNNLPLQGPQRPALPQGSRARERSKSWGPKNFNNINLAAQRRPSVV